MQLLATRHDPAPFCRSGKSWAVFAGTPSPELPLLRPPGHCAGSDRNGPIPSGSAKRNKPHGTLRARARASPAGPAGLLQAQSIVEAAAARQGFRPRSADSLWPTASHARGQRRACAQGWQRCLNFPFAQPPREGRPSSSAHTTRPPHPIQGASDLAEGLTWDSGDPDRAQLGPSQAGREGGFAPGRVGEDSEEGRGGGEKGGGGRSAHAHRGGNAVAAAPPDGMARLP